MSLHPETLHPETLQPEGPHPESGHAVEPAPPRLTPAELGIGARVSLHPHRDDFVDVIVGALDSVADDDVSLTTDDVTTFVRGTEDAVVRCVRDLILAAGRVGGHVVAHVLLSRGCPGEVDCTLDDESVLFAGAVPALPPTGVRAAAHWALYPLDDGGPGRTGDHMAAIAAAVEGARARVDVTPEHLVTRLDGDLADVLSTVAAGWLGAASTVRHVVTHVTIALASPSWDGRS